MYHYVKNVFFLFPGININNGTGNIDTASPQTKEDFDKFNDMLREKITEFEVV